MRMVNYILYPPSAYASLDGTYASLDGSGCNLKKDFINEKRKVLLSNTPSQQLLATVGIDCKIMLRNTYKQKLESV